MENVEYCTRLFVWNRRATSPSTWTLSPKPDVAEACDEQRGGLGPTQAVRNVTRSHRELLAPRVLPEPSLEKRAASTAARAGSR